MPLLLAKGGWVFWLILVTGAVAVAVFIERLLHYHRAQINSLEFLNGVKNVLKRENIVEAVSICDATPGPVARMVKVAILNRERGREGMREALEEAGLVEVPRLEEKLGVLATVAQIAPLMGLFGAVLGFMRVFWKVQTSGLPLQPPEFAAGMWQGLICLGAGLAVAVPAYVAHNFLVSRLNDVLLEMETSSTEIIHLLSGRGDGNGS
ncbi:MAG: MotA/TolQ/ExbB proton channel family protein [Verrucomicrobiales bacterium]|nr:MotA/TolQ/ExbB proton channel family protein [Verrucomicrobiales bacterium]